MKDNARFPFTVRFSTCTQSTFIGRPSEEEMNNRWYSAAENASFIRTLAKDARSTRMKLANAATSNITRIDLFEFIGVENFLSQDLMKRIIAQKENHKRTIMAEQARQYALRKGKNECIAYVSSRSSEWSRNRAQELAAGYWTIESDRVQTT